MYVSKAQLTFLTQLTIHGIANEQTPEDRDAVVHRIARTLEQFSDAVMDAELNLWKLAEDFYEAITKTLKKFSEPAPEELPLTSLMNFYDRVSNKIMLGSNPTYKGDAIKEARVETYNGYLILTITTSRKHEFIAQSPASVVGAVKFIRNS
jgi:hypothetical protein